MKALVPTALGVVLLGGCSSPPDHPELAVQRTEGGALVVHYEQCDDPALDTIRVTELWGQGPQPLAAFDAEQIAGVDPALGETAVAALSRRSWPPRLRIEVEGDDPFTTTFDPDDVPPVDWQLFVPDAPRGEEIVDLEDFVARCD